MQIIARGDFILGIIFSIVAGAAMSFQGVLNTALSKKIGLFESNTFVQGTAFIISLIVMFLFGNGSFKGIFDGPKVNLLGGAIGVLITATVMLSIKNLSPTVAISIILISQLITAAVIDYFGLFGAEKVSFHFTNFLGIALMVAGVILFKLKM